MIFHRALYTELWIRLKSDEVLGILDTDYIEDYFGQDGQISLYHVQDDLYYPVLMSSTPSETPTIPNDVFEGFYNLSSLPNGTYQLRGRVKNLAGNHTILTAVLSPFGDEGTINLGFEVQEGAGSTINIGSVELFGGYTLSIKPFEANTSASAPFKDAQNSNAVFSENVKGEAVQATEYIFKVKFNDG